jgi:hypothetical protein
MNNIFESRTLTTSVDTPSAVAPPPLIKKKNDTFFNEFLTKSDDLIAQTQFKLERLSKLDTITKPIAPKPNNLALDSKLKPASPPTVQPAVPLPVVTSIQIPEIITTMSITPLVDSNELNYFNMNNNNNNNDINNSKSLIDLKSSAEASAEVIASTAASTSSNINTIDLLFDVNNANSYSLNTEPLKQRDSYFDLIGISRSDSSSHVEQPPVNSFQTSNILNYSSTSTNNSRSNSPYRDDLLDSLLSQAPPPPPPLPLAPLESVTAYSVCLLLLLLTFLFMIYII